MKHCAIVFLATISLVQCSAVEKTNTAKSEFYEKWREGTTLQTGENRAVVPLVNYNNTFDSDNFVGVALDVRNQSPFKLARLKFYPHCRGGKKVVNFSYEFIGIERESVHLLFPGGQETNSQELQAQGRQSWFQGSLPVLQQRELAY